MSSPLDASLQVGQKVVHAAKPDWGVGTILRIEPTQPNGSGPRRVTVQFAVGSRVVQVPPARLVPPGPAVQRESGWLDKLAGRTLDDALRALPEEVQMHLGAPAQRLALIGRLYEHDEDGPSLLTWARRQTGIADPLEHWTRDELLSAFADYRRARDAVLCETAARLSRAEGPAAVEAMLAEFSARVAERIRAALSMRGAR